MADSAVDASSDDEIRVVLGDAGKNPPAQLTVVERIVPREIFNLVLKHNLRQVDVQIACTAREDRVHF